MLRGIDAAKAGMLSVIEYNDNLAHSLANANTTAFKQTKLSFKNIHDSMINALGQRNNNLEATNGLGTLSQGSQIDSYTIDFSQGLVKDTGRKFDFAIEGDGFFKLQTSQGQVYTRNGVMQIMTDGTITDNSGNPLMNDKGIVKIKNMEEVDGKEIPIDFNQLIVGNDGNITYKKQPWGKIDLYDFADKTKITDIGENHFVSADNNSNPPKLMETPNIKQGALEMSNANSIMTIINSMNAQRAYESISNVMQTNSTTLQKTINTVGKAVQ